jgi:hypothetical protein
MDVPFVSPDGTSLVQSLAIDPVALACHTRTPPIRAATRVAAKRRANGLIATLSTARKSSPASRLIAARQSNSIKVATIAVSAVSHFTTFEKFA